MQVLFEPLDPGKTCAIYCTPLSQNGRRALCGTHPPPFFTTMGVYHSLYRLSLSVLLFTAVNVWGAISLASSFSNTTTPIDSATQISGVIWSTQEVPITIAANVTEVETFYAGGGAHDYTTFTLTGPTTFITYYTDGSDYDCTYHLASQSYTITTDATKAETFIVGLDGHTSTGHDAFHLPWEIRTTIVLTGPTVFTTTAFNGSCTAVSPPYALQSVPAPKVTTTSAGPAATPASVMPASRPTTLSETSTAATSTHQAETVFNPQPATGLVVSSSTSTPKLPTIVNSPAPETRSQGGEPIPSPATDPAVSMQSSVNTANPPPNLPSLISVPAFTPAAQPVVSIESQLITPVPSRSDAVVVGGQTITQGQAPTIISGLLVSMASGSVYVDGQGTQLPVAPPPPVTVAGQTGFLVNPSAFVIGSQTAVLGGSTITVFFTPIAFNSGTLIVGTSTIPIPALPTIPIPPTTQFSYITIGTQAIAVGSSAIVVDGTTLSPGSPGITVGGTLISLGSSAFVVGTKTEALNPQSSAGATGSMDIGGLIMSGIGQLSGGSISTTTAARTGSGNTPTGTLFAGAAEGKIEPKSWQIVGIWLCVGTCLLGLM